MAVVHLIRRHPGSVFLVLWTLAAAALVYWIFQQPPAAPVVIRGNEAGEAGGWPLFDHSFYPIYPWLLLAPLVTALCWRFPIGLSPARVAVPLVFLGGAAFVLASHAFTKLYADRLPSLTYISVQTVTSIGSSDTLLENLLPAGTQPDKPSIEISYSFDAEQLSKLLGLDLDPAAAAPAPAGLIEAAAVQASSRGLGSFLHLGGFLLIAGLAHLGRSFHSIQERERRHANLSRELSEARLAGLHAQLRPHFLFNALNVIAGEVHDKPDDAAAMIVHLSDLLRSSLTLDRGRQLIPLRRELGMLDDYLAIQTRRFGDRLTVCRRIDPDTFDLFVPPFLIQPVVENALHHGLEPLARPGTLTIAARRLDDRLELIIEDDGLGLDPGHGRPASQAAKLASGTGTGLINIRRRLETLFPGRHSLDLAPASPRGGCRVTLLVPLATGQS